MAAEVAEYMVYIDPSKCMGCRACEVACAVEHSLAKNVYGAILEEPRPKYRIKVVAVDSFNVPIRCQHCERAPCINACPTKALYRSDEGFVMVNPLACIGCKMCIIVCPFGHLRYDVHAKTIVKCDFCADRVREGRVPACVEACPTGALRFGPAEEVLKEVARGRAKQLISGVTSAVGPAMYGPTAPPPPQELSPLQALHEKYSPVRWY